MGKRVSKSNNDFIARSCQGATGKKEGPYVPFQSNNIFVVSCCEHETQPFDLGYKQLSTCKS